MVPQTATPEMADHRPIPYPVVVSHMTLAQLCRATDSLLGEMRACAATDDPDGEDRAERRFNVAHDEIDRREAKKAERGAKRQARIQRESAAWYAEREAGGGR